MRKYGTLVTDIGWVKMADAVLNGEKVNITDPNAHANLRTAIENLAASQAAKRKITIPASAWVKGTDGSYSASVALADVNTTHTVLVILDKAGKSTAAECGMDSYVETTDGALLFRASTVPS